MRERQATSQGCREGGGKRLERTILTVNSGSSSVKFSVYRLGASETLLLHGHLDRIGVKEGLFRIRDASGNLLADRGAEFADHAAAFDTFFGWLRSHEIFDTLHAAGHRLVHGGAEHVRPLLISPEVLDDLRALIPLAPDHLPHQIEAVKTVGRTVPDIPQVACFDTAFHRRMPAVAQKLALPPEYTRAGVIRYGFHGLSYEFILGELGRQAGDEAMRGRVIVAHLGNGASMVALREGKSFDTTMGMTPTGGLVMSTRCGDLDPGAVLFLLRERGMSPDEVNFLLNRRAGLLGVSGISSNMQDLLAHEDRNPHAALAVALFCYQAKKFLGALAAALGGLDTLIFTGGIGENSAPIRRRICENLEFLGIRLDVAQNDANAPVISAPAAPVSVRVMKTNEELMIARHAHSLLRSRKEA